jgi:putative ABC transport system permease protein
VITVVNIFSIGFIVLISLIAAANVFNTISTNIALRRREFAMLKSIGMTQKGFNKMMNFECLLYGLKGLVYGIPVSIGITWLIYQSILNGWETGFFIPWHSIVIAVGSVFAVVFATMLYAMDRIKKDNPIDALKNENL